MMQTNSLSKTNSNSNFKLSTSLLVGLFSHDSSLSHLRNLRFLMHRHMYNVIESDGALCNSPAYQDDEFCGEGCRQNVISDVTCQHPSNRDDEEPTVFEAAEIALLMKDKFTTMVKEMTHLWHIAVTMKELTSRLIVMMNSL